MVSKGRQRSPNDDNERRSLKPPWPSRGGQGDRLPRGSRGVRRERESMSEIVRERERECMCE